MAAPGQVVGLTATPHSTTSVRLQWDATAGAVTYNVYYKYVTSITYSQITLVGTVTYDVTGLLPCSNYNFKVAAVNGDGEGTHSAVVEERAGCAWEVNWKEAGLYPTESFVAGAKFDEAFAESNAVSEALDIIPAFIWVDALTPTEHFAERNQQLTEKDWVDSVTPEESLTTQGFALAYSEGSMLITAVSTKLYGYDEFAVTGYVETKRIDFDLPGVGKTLSQIQWEGYAADSILVQVSVSLDGGVTWTALEPREVEGRFQAFAYPWLTAESFIIRFAGCPLSITSILAQAIPTTGVHIPEAASIEEPYGG